jgi:excisionase family DNA binding protein
MQDKFFTLNEVSKYLKIPKSTLYKLSQRGKIPSIKIGKQLRFRKSSLDNWLSVKEAKLTAAPTKKAKRILLVDDDPLVLKTLAQLLQKHGYIVEPAESGEEALEKAKKSRFDLLVTDIRMPGMDGIETIKRLRQFNADTRRQRIPEIIITGYIDPQSQKEAQTLGISDYLYKPFSIDDFISAVQKN